jgi:hypothetical protein
MNLDGCLAKLDRAREHIVTLRDAEREYFDGPEGRPFTTERSFDPASNVYTFFAQVTRTPPLRIGTILGDIVHNLRSTLDHLVWQMVLEHSGDPSALRPRPYFPICLTESDWERVLAKGVRGVSSESSAMLRSVQPFVTNPLQPERAPLNTLHELWNQDKHRVILAIAAALGTHDREMTFVKTPVHRPDAEFVAIRDVAEIHYDDAWSYWGMPLDRHPMVEVRITPSGPTPVLGLRMTALSVSRSRITTRSTTLWRSWRWQSTTSFSPARNKRRHSRLGVVRLRVVEHRLEDALKRIAEADAAWSRDGNQPTSFHLMHLGGMRIAIDHPCWDRSWSVPNEHTIDDLGELGHLRVESPSNLNRTFVLTMEGRAAGQALIPGVGVPAAPSGGHVPGVNKVLGWLVTLEGEDPSAFEMPVRILEQAVRSGFVESTSRERLAKRIVSLYEQGYLTGDLPDADQWTDEQRLQMSSGVELTMRAHEAAAPSSSPIAPSPPTSLPDQSVAHVEGDSTGKRDVFISHASEDKNAIARPLAEELARRGVTVWFDEYELLLGDSLRGSINHGLATSTIGVVILSHSFYAKQWTKQELAALHARLSSGERNVIVPIWHELTKVDLLKYDPLIADLRAGQSAQGVSYLADEIERVLRRRRTATGDDPGRHLPVRPAQSVSTLPKAITGVLCSLLGWDSRSVLHLELAAASEMFDGLTNRDVDDSLLESQRMGLIVGERGAGDRSVTWWSYLRLTVRGLREINQWPPEGRERDVGPWSTGYWGTRALPLLRQLRDRLPNGRFYLKPVGGDLDDDAWADWNALLTLTSAALVAGDQTQDGVDNVRVTAAGQQVVDDLVAELGRSENSGSGGLRAHLLDGDETFS